jgi:riboflavin-specific deaminase-like protein
VSKNESAPRPSVTLKWAQTLDGRVATITGHSRWISGTQARILAHRLRAEHDGILVGVGTVLADNSELTTRLAAGLDPIPIVLDSHLRTPVDAAIARRGTIIAALSGPGEDRGDALVARGVEIVRTTGREGRIDLVPLLVLLRKRGIRRLLVEGGAAVLTSFLRARLADEVVIVVAPRVLGTGVDAVGDLGVTVMGNCVGFADVGFERLGVDAVFRGRPIWPA